jgi:Fe-S-cluster-containing hydrogenase component 2
MLPNRRLREALERAERAAGARRTSFDDEPTRVPHADEMPGSAPLPHEAISVDSGEFEIQEEPAFVAREDATRETPVPERQAHAEGLSWEDEETRIDPMSDGTLEVSELVEVYEVGDLRASNSAKTTVHRSERPERNDEKSVIKRFVNAVTAVPRAIKRAYDEATGAHKITAPAPAPQKREKFKPARSNHTIDQRAWRDMRTAPIFDGLPNEALRDALLSGDALVLKVGRDVLLPLAGHVALVRSGQVALALFSEETLRTERKAWEELRRQEGSDKYDKAVKREKKRRSEVGPLIELAEKNLATFEEGDVVELVPGFGEHSHMACYSVTPAHAIVISRARVDLWKRIYPFMADRFRRANQTARARLDATDGARALVADFFIRHGLSVSMTLRVRKIDSCIECYACETACEDRYGVKRLSLNGRILGGLDFVDACHTCTDQRCIDPCNFDAISFDAARKEVLIKEDACTGCTLCAVACPYDAIEMHELDQAPMLKLRLEKAGALKFGDGTPRKAKLRRMASKCDHCAFYEDQACISACPTGALVEVLPQDVITTLPDQARATAKAGFDRTAAINVDALNQASAFVKGLEIPELGRARAPRTKLLIGLWWTLGLFSVAAGGVEILLRKLLPALSASYWLAVHVDGIDPELALSRVDYRPGNELAVNFGYAGTFIMISGLFYVWRRRLSFMRNWGSLRAWFDWHVMTGVVGPIFILYHSAAKLDNWVSLAFWSMVLTVISGLLGRYLTTELPERASTAMVETLEVDRKLSELRSAHPGVRVADGWFENYRRRVALWERRLNGSAKEKDKKKKATFLGAIATFFWVAKDDLFRGRRRRALKKALKAAVRGKAARKVRREAIRYAERLALLERRRVLMPRLEPLFRQWRAVHVPMAVALTVIAGLHIFLALRS